MDQLMSDTLEKPMPVLAVRAVNQWGVSPSGDQAIMIVESATQGRIKLAFDFHVLMDMAKTAREAAGQALKNSKDDPQRGESEVMMTAVVVNNFAVGTAAGVDGILFVVDPDTAQEQPFVVSNEQALRAGQLLVRTSAERERQAQRLKIKLQRPRLIMPGRQ